MLTSLGRVEMSCKWIELEHVVILLYHVYMYFFVLICSQEFNTLNEFHLKDSTK